MLLRTVVTRLSVSIALVGILSAPTAAQDQFFDSNGVRIRYVELGTGEPIVLLHGGGANVETWAQAGVLPALARNHRVIAFDARGYGKSGKPHDPSAYGHEVSEDVVRLLNHLQIQKAHIVGYSMGGHTVAHLLVHHPERFLSATLGGSAGWFRWNAELAQRTELEAAEHERECISRSQNARLAPLNQPTPTEAEIQKQIAACMADPNIDRFAQAAVFRGFKDQAITTEEVRAVKVPTLAVVGSLDAYLSDFEELVRLRPDVKLVVVNNATHGGDRGTMRRPEFVEAITQFVDGHPIH